MNIKKNSTLLTVSLILLGLMSTMVVGSAKKSCVPYCNAGTTVRCMNNLSKKTGNAICVKDGIDGNGHQKWRVSCRVGSAEGCAMNGGAGGYPTCSGCPKQTQFRKNPK
ncbi:secreted protein [Melampsora americana]|nr:secreted protein [Melampsora americana]